MNIGFWQIAYTALLMLSLGMHLAMHNKPKTGKYNFWIALVSCAIQFGMLYFGGFYG